jgi:hypothetical protein
MSKWLHLFCFPQCHSTKNNFFTHCTSLNTQLPW